MTTLSRRAAAGLVPVALLAAGCGADATYGDVFGAVTLDGRPVPNGAITFSPVGGHTHTASAVIADGTFVARVPVARHRVWITSPKPLPPGADPNRVPAEERIPARYNTRSRLEVEVAAGRNDLPLDLTSR